MGSMHLVLAASSVSRNEKLLGALIGVSIIVLLYIVTSVGSKPRQWNPLKVIEGQDGTWSTSKFQWFLWLIVVLFAYVFLWFIRTRSGHWGAIPNVPGNLLAVLGFSTVTAVGAKGITVGYLKSGSITKADSSAAAAVAPGAPAAPAPPGGLLVDDSGTPELAKIQMVGFTFVAIMIFLWDVYHQARGSHPTAQLPNIDGSLLVLMGISQGGYIGKKLVTLSTPFINTITPTTQKVGGTVEIDGASFGSGAGSSRLLLDGSPIPTTTWTDTQIVFAVPANYPKAGKEQWPAVKVVQLGIDLGGGTRGNEVTLTVTP
jgi:IPT/TIG domain